MSLAGCSYNNTIMEQDLNNFSLVSLPREKKRKKKLVNRLVQFILKKEDKEEEENLKILRLIRPPRYKPKPLGQIVAETGYSAKEVKQFYRAFKQECPSGISDEETFKEVYAKIFPLGESGKYAHIVFSCIDTTGCGRISFDDFMTFLSTMRLSSQDDKIGLSFLFCDLNKDGVLTQDELFKVECYCSHPLLMPAGFWPFQAPQSPPSSCPQKERKS